jgi:hypothetical protein
MTGLPRAIPVAAWCETWVWRPFACWDCGFESWWVRGCLSLVNFMVCQVEFSATGLSLVQRSRTMWCVCVCVCVCVVIGCDREHQEPSVPTMSK